MDRVIVWPAWLFTDALLAYMSMAVRVLLTKLSIAAVVLKDALALLACHFLILLLKALSAAAFTHEHLWEHDEHFSLHTVGVGSVSGYLPNSTS